jgi:hypothetical protein
MTAELQEAWRRERVRINRERREHRERMEAQGYEVASPAYPLPAGPPSSWRPDGEPSEGVWRDSKTGQPVQPAGEAELQGVPARHTGRAAAVVRRVATALGGELIAS